MFCGSPGHQFDRYYKDGALDGCGRPLAELGFCLRLKTAGPQDTRRLLAELLHSRSPPPSAGAVWQLKPPPPSAPPSGP